MSLPIVVRVTYLIWFFDQRKIGWLMFRYCPHSQIVDIHQLPVDTYYSIHLWIMSLPMFRLWTKGFYNLINQHLSQIDWDYEFSYLGVDSMYTFFLDLVHFLVAEYVPVSSRPPSSTPWPVKRPPALKQRRSFLWGHYKAVRSHLGRNSAEAREALQQFLNVNYQYITYALYFDA